MKVVCIDITYYSYTNPFLELNKTYEVEEVRKISDGKTLMKIGI